MGMLGFGVGLCKRKTPTIEENKNIPVNKVSVNTVKKTKDSVKIEKEKQVVQQATGNTTKEVFTRKTIKKQLKKETDNVKKVDKSYWNFPK